MQQCLQHLSKPFARLGVAREQLQEHLRAFHSRNAQTHARLLARRLGLGALVLPAAAVADSGLHGTAAELLARLARTTRALLVRCARPPRARADLSTHTHACARWRSLAARARALGSSAVGLQDFYQELAATLCPEWLDRCGAAPQFWGAREGPVVRGTREWWPGIVARRAPRTHTRRLLR